MSKALQTSLTLLALLLSYSAAAEPLYFKAKKGGKELMVLGSIHVGKSNMYPLPEPIIRFLKSSDALITEIKLSGATPDIPLDTELTTDVLDKQQKQKLGEINTELGFSPNAFLSVPAWQTALSLQITQFTKMGFTQELGIDNYITEQAEQLSKKVLGLESIEYQLNLFTEDPNVSRVLLTDTIDNWQENVRISECLIESWDAGNKQELAELASKSAIGEQLSDQFIYQRNRNWATKLNSDQFAPDGKYLVVVGALHLVGRDNLMELLSQKGYQVTQLSQEKAVKCQ
jgi:uncharacterized protein YbaP (TraB family)